LKQIRRALRFRQRTHARTTTVFFGLDALAIISPGIEQDLLAIGKAAIKDSGIYVERSSLQFEIRDRSTLAISEKSIGVLPFEKFERRKSQRLLC
jgi:hypothetical protein